MTNVEAIVKVALTDRKGRIRAKVGTKGTVIMRVLNSAGTCGVLLKVN